VLKADIGKEEKKMGDKSENQEVRGKNLERKIFNRMRQP